MDPGGNLTHINTAEQRGEGAFVDEPAGVDSSSLVAFISLRRLIFILFFILVEGVHSAGFGISFDRHRVDEIFCVWRKL